MIMRTGIYFETNLWEEVLKESKYDFYHLPGYLQLECELIQGEAIYFYYEESNSRAVIPLVKRRIGTSEYFDVVNPYGYAGILINKHFDYKLFSDIITSFYKSCYKDNIISAFFRLNPVLNNYLFFESENIKQEIHGRTVFIDLSENYETLLSSYSSNHKRNIKKLKKEGFQVRINDWSQYEAWQELYINTMQRLAASKYYFFDKKYFNRLSELLKSNLLLVSVHNKEGRLAAGGLFTKFNGVIQYHLGGTNEEFLSLAPTKLMFDEIIRWGTENKFEMLHLGGGLGGDTDSLFNFKNGFSKKTMHFTTLRCITNKVVYDQMVKDKFSHRTDLDLKQVHYFPLYRFQ